MDLGERARNAVHHCEQHQAAQVTCVLVNQEEGIAVAQGKCLLCEELRASCVEEHDNEVLIAGRCGLAGIFKDEQ